MSECVVGLINGISLQAGATMHDVCCTVYDSRILDKIPKNESVYGVTACWLVFDQ